MGRNLRKPSRPSPSDEVGASARVTTGRHVVERLVKESNETMLEAEFAVAEKFHANFYHDFMEDYEIVQRPPDTVSRFVHRIIEIAETE